MRELVIQCRDREAIIRYLHRIVECFGRDNRAFGEVQFLCERLGPLTAEERTHLQLLNHWSDQHEPHDAWDQGWHSLVCD